MSTTASVDEMERTSEPQNRAVRRTAAVDAHGGTRKYGWKVAEWSTAVGCSRARTYQLIVAGAIDSVRFGGSRIIRTHPADFVAALGGEAE
jgi:hypothetical protein